jgi:hypothetical protein
MKNHHKFHRSLKIAALAIIVAAAVFIGFTKSGVVSAAGGAFFGAIYDSDSTSIPVNKNLHTNKDDVYLNGGPQNDNANGLPAPETFFFQVTDPSGATLLSTDPALCRQLIVAEDPNGKGRVMGPASGRPSYCTDGTLFPVDSGDGGTVFGGNHVAGDLNLANHSIAVQLMPFNDTPNGGGEYKVWLIRQGPTTTIDENDNRVLHFAGGDTKTDNFKIEEIDPNCPPNDPTCNQPPPAQIGGIKYYDTNYNGTRQDGEPTIAGWHIELFQDDIEINETDTDADGAYQFLVDFVEGAVYKVCETVPAGWQATTVTCHTITLVSVAGEPDLTYPGNDFGNIRIFDIGGRKYKDSNMNGSADSGEVGVRNVTINVSVTYPNGTTANLQAITSSFGFWSIPGLPEGTIFTACEVVPTGWISTTGSVCLAEGTVSGNITDLNFYNIPVFPISGVKYYDSDLNGIFSGGDTGLAGIKITISAIWPNGTVDSEVLYTGAGGAWTSKAFPEVSTYTVTETLPGTNWTQVTSSGTVGTVNGANASVDFLNVCRLTPGGRTLGFWSNKNGLAMVTAADFTRLTGYDLRVANGGQRDFTAAAIDSNRKTLNSWLLSASATNMAYMLSAQMTATDLSVAKGFTNPSIIVDGTTVNVAQLIAYANSLLANPIVGGPFAGQNGSLTVSSGALRTEQERVKNILDKINNVGSFAQPTACSFTTPY